MPELAVAKQKLEKIKKSASTRLAQDGEKPFILDKGGMAAYYRGVGRLIWAVIGITLIIPLYIIGGMLDGVTMGLRAGIKTVDEVYREHLR